MDQLFIPPLVLQRFVPTVPRSGPSVPPSSPQPEILDPPLGAPTLWKSWLCACRDDVWPVHSV